MRKPTRSSLIDAILDWIIRKKTTSGPLPGRLYIPKRRPSPSTGEPPEEPSPSAVHGDDNGNQPH
jgi:hypothetical protein